MVQPGVHRDVLKFQFKKIFYVCAGVVCFILSYRIAMITLLAMQYSMKNKSQIDKLKNLIFTNHPPMCVSLEKAT